MSYRLDRFSDSSRADALDELRAELADFSHDGIVQLAADLGNRTVLRGSWSGCVISYKRGTPGSCRRDRFGRARNAFTILWDNGWMTDEEVLATVQAELARRSLADTGARPAPSVGAAARPGVGVQKSTA
jgi:hypothetical protein